MITYKLNITTNELCNEFGISAFSGDTLIKSVYSITDNKNDVVELIDMCNELELDVCHLDDIVEDYLTDFSI